MENKVFKKEDAKKGVDLTDRQIDYLEDKSETKSSDSKWKKYTFNDVLVLRILSELRKFGIEVNKLLELKKWLQKDGAIDFLLKKMNIGFSMFLCTNLVDYFGFEDDSEGYDFVFLIGNHKNEKGKEELDEPKIVLPLNGIVRDLIDRLAVETNLNTEVNHQLKLPSLMNAVSKKENLDIKEKQLIEIIREKPFQNIIVKVNDGKVVHLVREESITLN